MISLVLFTMASPWLLWIVYAGIMRLKMLKDAGMLTTAQKAFGYPWLAVGLVLDAFVNLVVASAIFMERPKEWTVSARLWRLSNGEPGRQQRWAMAIRTALLDALDPSGTHRG